VAVFLLLAGSSVPVVPLFPYTTLFRSLPAGWGPARPPSAGAWPKGWAAPTRSAAPPLPSSTITAGPGPWPTLTCTASTRKTTWPQPASTTIWTRGRWWPPSGARTLPPCWPRRTPSGWTSRSWTRPAARSPSRGCSYEHPGRRYRGQDRRRGPDAGRPPFVRGVFRRRADPQRDPAAPDRHLSQAVRADLRRHRPVRRQRRARQLYRAADRAGGGQGARFPPQYALRAGLHPGGPGRRPCGPGDRPLRPGRPAGTGLLRRLRPGHPRPP